MDDETICHHLEQLAAHLEICIRYEPSAGKAGYCVLRGEKTIFIDQRLSQRGRGAALARMLCTHDCEDVFLPPVVREMLEVGRRVDEGKPADPERVL